jgi:hypothetical protein
MIASGGSEHALPPIEVSVDEWGPRRVTRVMPISCARAGSHGSGVVNGPFNDGGCESGPRSRLAERQGRPWMHCAGFDLI